MAMFNEALLESMKNMINDNEWMDTKAEKVTAYEEVEKAGGYCETCYHEWTEVNINYLDTSGKEQVYNYYGDFGDLIRELTKY